MTTEEIDQLDVVVVGAGATGLTAADILVRQGYRVAVIEARERVGGRLLTEVRDGVLLELGGQWVSPDQTALLETIDDLGLETYQRYRTGSSVYIGRDGVRQEFEGETFPVPESTGGEIDRLIAQLDELSRQMDPARPWDLPDAGPLDAVSFADWLAEQTDDQEARDAVGLFIGPAMLTKPPGTFSALQAVHMAASAGGFAHLVDSEFILDRRVDGGLQRVPELLAERFTAAGGRVCLETPVRSVSWEADRVVVETDETSLRARRALLALPPPLAARIAFTPELPEVQREVQAHQSFGMVIKLHISYATPFWRDLGLSGTAFSPYEPVHEAYDNTAFGDPRGTLVGFVSDDHAVRLLALDPDARRAEVLGSLERYYGDQALSPTSYAESDWLTEEWTGGAYATSFDLGFLSRLGPHLGEDVGPLSFASSDTAGAGFQHVDGAIRMGRAAADRISAALHRA